MVGKKAFIGTIAGIVVGTASILLSDALGAIALGDIARSIALAVHKTMAIQVPLWGVLFVSFLLFIAVSLHLSFVVFRKRPATDPEWLGFTKLPYKGRLFEWDYSYDDDAEPVNFRELCPECEYGLDGNDCPQCGRSRPFVFRGQAFNITHPIPEAVIKLVKGHIKSGKYRDIMAESTPRTTPPN